MKKILIILLIAVILISGCKKTEVTGDLIKDDIEIQGFMVKYPEAEASQIFFSKQQVIEILDYLKERCGEHIQAKDYYLVKVEDQKSRTYLSTWIDANSNEVVCKIESTEEELPKITGSVIGRIVSPNIIQEDQVVGKTPSIAALRRSLSQSITEDVLSKILIEDDKEVIINPTRSPAHNLDNYLQFAWGSNIRRISILMKGSNGNPYFEIWNNKDILVSSGKLDQEYKWYSFDVSSEELASESFALYNYEFGGTGDIVVNKIVGDSISEGAGLKQITGLSVVDIPAKKDSILVTNFLIVIISSILALFLYLRFRPRKHRE